MDANKLVARGDALNAMDSKGFLMLFHEAETCEPACPR
jgi:hypothetical protein